MTKRGLIILVIILLLCSIWKELYNINIYPITITLRLTTNRQPCTKNELNWTVVKEWESLKEPLQPFISNDSLIVEERPYPFDYVQNQDVHVCQEDTYLVLLYLSRVNEVGIRNLIRRNVPQGVVINGKKVNRLFVIAVRNSDKSNMHFIRQEKKEYGDIIISPHQDSKSRIAISVWDGFLWIRNHCSHAVFAAKVDPDEVIFLGNLINYLSHVPTKRFYGGNYRECVMKARKDGDLFVYFPKDYPYCTKVYYVSGALAILTIDLIDHLIVGAMYEPFFGLCTDDFMIGAVLNRVGILPQRLTFPNCTLLELNLNPNNSYVDYVRVSDHVVVYHGMKKEKQLAEALQVFSNRIFKPTGC